MVSSIPPTRNTIAMNSISYRDDDAARIPFYLLTPYVNHFIVTSCKQHLERREKGGVCWDFLEFSPDAFQLLSSHFCCLLKLLLGNLCARVGI